MINKDFLMGYGAGKAAGGGGDVAVQALDVDKNGTYRAQSGKAYSPVNVNVPNSYAAEDEGKVVSDGELVAQTGATYTLNDTYDTTLIDSVTVAVFGQSNVITGEFTTGGTNTVSDVAIPYNGNGFPLMVAVWWDGGDNWTQYTSGDVIRQIMAVKMTKNAPAYSPDVPDDDDKCIPTLSVVRLPYGPDAYTAAELTSFRTGGVNYSSWMNTFEFASNTTMKFQVAPDGFYGLAANAKYKYVVIYSS